MSEHLYLLSMVLPLATILLVFGMKYFANVRQARARVLSEDAYRELAQKALTAQTEIANVLAGVHADLSEIKSRLGSVEKILQAVE